eukprot:31441-Pelagococcus_subviridis.AAC.9
MSPAARSSYLVLASSSATAGGVRTAKKIKAKRREGEGGEAAKKKTQSQSHLSSAAKDCNRPNASRRCPSAH